MEKLTDSAQGYCEMYCKKYGRCFGDPGDCVFQNEVKMYEALKDYECTGMSPMDIKTIAATAIREQEERRWIPVSERIPEIGRKCLIANREIVVRGWLRPDGVWKTGVSSDEIWSKFSLYPPTHWMPLPEPPKGE